MEKRRVLLAVVGAFSALALVGGAAARGSATTFSDAAGDSKGAPDITAVSVSDVPATGVITVAVTASGFASADPASHPEVIVYLDTDKNPATGDSGSDYLVAVANAPDGGGWDLERWDGSQWGSVSQSGTISYSESGDTHTWSFSKDAVGGTSGFAFVAAAATFDASLHVTALDLAPDGGVWAYALTQAAPVVPLKAVVGAPTVKPAVARVGTPFSVTFPVTRSDDGTPLNTGAMTCDPSVSGKVISHVELFSGGKAQLSFTIPKSAKGKLLKVKVTIKVGAQSTTKVVSFHVR